MEEYRLGSFYRAAPKQRACFDGSLKKEKTRTKRDTRLCWNSRTSNSSKSSVFIRFPNHTTDLNLRSLPSTVNLHVSGPGTSYNISQGGNLCQWGLSRGGMPRVLPGI
ncbi:hypothetical protein KOW79_006546 [Hemibagrus wyckioides]|uniref:Uncharacterized protein n=1 Tax=Hemibagrus wyckioides TaxID=337641 RepID=A0A9D3NXF0_9TELE|nr:hypothetical protein KOW79_006546 [Hemibagrus wyckioides]